MGNYVYKNCIIRMSAKMLESLYNILDFRSRSNALRYIRDCPVIAGVFNIWRSSLCFISLFSFNMESRDFLYVQRQERQKQGPCNQGYSAN